MDKQTNDIAPQRSGGSLSTESRPVGKQARFGAAGISELRRTGNAKYRTTMAKHRIAKEGWSIVATADLTVQPVSGVEAGKPAPIPKPCRRCEN